VTRRPLALLAALLAVGALVAGCSSSSSSSSAPAAKASGLNDNTGSSSGFEGLGIDPPQPRPSFTLTTTTGASFDFGTVTAGHPTLLYFGYTNCPDICPATMADIGLALKAVPAAMQKMTYVVFVSTDVAHDTGPIIAQWLHNFSPGNGATWVGLHGTQAQVDAAEAAAHVFLATDGGQTHSAEVLLFGTDDYARDSFAYTADGEQAEIQHDLPLVARA
jgi:protein SCO1/2